MPKLLRPSSAAMLAALATVALPACRPNDGDVRQAGEAVRDTALIDGTAPGCARCSLDVGTPLRLGSAADADIPRRVPGMLRDSRGTTYLTFHGWANQPILRYDSTGGPPRRIGRLGRGPGEYGMTSGAFIGPGDSLYVQSSHGQLIVYAPDGSFSRTVLVMPLRIFAARPDGSMYGTRYRPRPLRSTEIVYRTSADGSVRDSVVLANVRTGLPGWSTVGGRKVEFEIYLDAQPMLSSDGLWVHFEETFRLQHYDSAGVADRLFGVTVPGATPVILTDAQADSIASRIKAGDRSVASRVIEPFTGGGKSPRPRIDAMVDTAGLIWVMRTVEAPGWDTIRVQAIKGSPDEAPEEVSIPREIEDRWYRTVVEVFDPALRQLIARTELPFLGILAAPGQIGRVSQDDDGYYVASVYPLRLHRAAAARRPSR